MRLPPAVRALVPADRAAVRLARCLAGLGLFGTGITAIIQADLGAAPWDVFHTGVSERAGLATGTVIILTGVALLLLWVPLGVRPGLGTLLNATVVGLVVDLTLPRVPSPGALVARSALLGGGVVLVAVGSGLYIGAGLGPGPRDGLMTGLARRGAFGRSVSIGAARTGVEVTVLLVGAALGGSVGVGTAVFALGIGPLVGLVLPGLSLDDGRGEGARRAR